MALTVFSLQNENGEFNLSRGFLPKSDPIQKLPSSFDPWESLLTDLPNLLLNGQIQTSIKRLPPFDINALTSENYERAMLVLSYLGHAYIWNNTKPADRLPAVLAKPWFHVAKTLNRPPILSYASYVLYNWQRLNKENPITLNNTSLLQRFIHDSDEEWFILIHLNIEVEAATGLNQFTRIPEAINQKDNEKLILYFNTMIISLDNMIKVLKRMHERCDPHIYYNRIRPYIHGWDNPALPNGLIYEGVDAYQSKAQFFKGATGAQSTIIPAYDILFEIKHENNPLKNHLYEMQLYIPIEHRQFLATVRRFPSLRSYITQNYGKENKLKTLYNECIKLLGLFRQIHLGYAARYIKKQRQTSIANSLHLGTGGTPFEYLYKYLYKTQNHLI